MAFAAPVFGAIFGGAAAGTATGATALTKLATAARIGSGIVSTVAGLASANYNAEVAKNNAEIADQNAARIKQQAAVHAQDQDVEAREEIGAILASAGASGLSLGTGSKFMQRQSAEKLAAKDRGYTIYRGQVEAEAEEARAADFRASASLSNSLGTNTAISGIFDVGTSLISGAAKVNRIRANTIRRTA